MGGTHAITIVIGASGRQRSDTTLFTKQRLSQLSYAGKEMVR